LSDIYAIGLKRTQVILQANEGKCVRKLFQNLSLVATDWMTSLTVWSIPFFQNPGWA